MEIGDRVERRFYSSVWLAFMQRFNIPRTYAVFNDFNHCVGIKICKSIDEFKSLRVLEKQSEPDSRTVLFGTTKLRITVWSDYLAIEEAS